MIEFLDQLVKNSSLPTLSAFLLGVMVSFGPCAVAANLSAVFFIAHHTKNVKSTLLGSFYYALGRAISYTIIAGIIYFGVATFALARFFHNWGYVALGPILILLSLILFNVIKIKFSLIKETPEEAEKKIKRRGPINLLWLGILFASFFCPYSGLLFFAIFIPLMLKAEVGYFLPLIFALGTAVPVAILAIIIVFSQDRLNKILAATKKTENALRYLAGVICLVAGVYYLQYLVRWLQS